MFTKRYCEKVMRYNISVLIIGLKIHINFVPLSVAHPVGFLNVTVHATRHVMIHVGIYCACNTACRDPCCYFACPERWLGMLV